MKHYTLYELTRALEETQNMPYGLMPGAVETAQKTAREDPAYAWVLPTMRELVDEYGRTPIEAPTYQAFAAWARYSCTASTLKSAMRDSAFLRMYAGMLSWRTVR